MKLICNSCETKYDDKPGMIVGDTCPVCKGKVSKQYKQLGLMSFGIETPDRVCQILESASNTRQRLRIFYGADGKVWNEEYDILGCIGRSTGSIKIPLMIKNSRSLGGGGVLDDCIVRIQDVATKRVLYHNEAYTLPEYDIRQADKDLQSRGYTFSVWIEDQNQNVANFKTEQQAVRYIAFMRGERMAK
jgi:hypothetical protein